MSDELFPDLAGSVSLDAQIAEVKRELAQREHAFPRFVQRGMLTVREANRRTAAMKAALATLLAVREARREPERGA